MMGLAITKTAKGLTVHQNQFIKDMALRYGQDQCKPVKSPIACGDVPAGASPLLPPGHNYLSLVGSLLWATITRPDVAVAVSKACSRSINPTKADKAAAVRILRYLLHTPHVKLTFNTMTSTVPPVSVFVDAAWANEPKSRSRYGYVVCVYGCPIMWATKVSTMVCLSTAEAEYVAAVQEVKSAIWIRAMVAELQGRDLPPVTVYEDNQACIKMATNPVVSGRNRHFAMRMWWLRQQVEDGAVVFKYVPTESQLADMFTKVLPAPEFVKHRDALLSTTPAVYRQ